MRIHQEIESREKTNAGGWPDGTLARFVDEAKAIGESYGRTVGYLANAFDDWAGFDEHTRRHLANVGTEPGVIRLAERFAERAYWAGRLTVTQAGER